MNEGDGYIYGAAYDSFPIVRHICSHGKENIDRIRKSKYVLSDLSGIYEEIRNLLKSEKRVLFSGTPCQCVAVQNYCKDLSTKDNLFLIDLVCHGAPSQKIFNDYVKLEEMKIGRKINEIVFRHKLYNKFEGWTTRNVCIYLENGKQIIKRRFRCNYLRAYHPCLMNRISCYECFFSKPDRYSDITIGDFWGIRKFYPELSVEHGVSIVQVNTVKGEKLEKYIRSNSICYDINICDYKAKMRNGLAKPGGIIINKNRLNFLRMEREHGFDYAIRGVFPLYKDFFAFIKAYAKTKIKGFIG